MTPVIEAKWAALAEYKRTPSERNLQIFRIARNKAQQTAQGCTNEYWTELSENIQSAAKTGNVRGMYDGIKKALGPILKKIAPLRSSNGEVITVRRHQLGRWVEHYSDLYSRENIMSLSALDAVECLPTMQELDTANFGGAQQGYCQLGLWQGHRQQQNPPSLIKHCKTTLLHSLHVFLCQCWQEGATPQDIRDAKIITLFKNKREREEWLQQLQRHLPSQRHWQSLCKGHLDPTAEAGRTCLSWIIVWLPSWKVSNRHGLLRLPTPV